MIAFSAPVRAHGLTDEIAICTGRLSAQLEHQWLVHDPASAETERTRNDLADVLAALTTTDSARQLLATRISAKHAHARLLQRSVFNDDMTDARWAARKAARDVARCATLVLGSTTADEQA